MRGYAHILWRIIIGFLSHTWRLPMLVPRSTSTSYISFSADTFWSPSTGFKLSKLIYCCTNRLSLCPAHYITRPQSLYKNIASIVLSGTLSRKPNLWIYIKWYCQLTTPTIDMSCMFKRFQTSNISFHDIHITKYSILITNTLILTSKCSGFD